ncbi:hypothetical protein Tco_1431840, partial [Tanacetum coccineum]
LRMMDDRLMDIDSNNYPLSNEVEELTKVVSGMSEQYDQFYSEFRLMRVEQERFHMSQLLSYHHLDHTRFDGTQYTYVIDIFNLGVQQGVNFMSSPQTYSTAPPDPTANLFVLFGDVLLLLRTS